VVDAVPAHEASVRGGALANSFAVSALGGESGFKGEVGDEETVLVSFIRA
jgi:hypothetical protein